MREIKFRAWDNKERKWELGYELPNLGGFSMYGETILLGEYSHMIDKYLFSRDGYTPNDLKLMQYTGLKDKNGKEIYEGDVVKVIETAHSENRVQKQLRGSDADYVVSDYIGVVTWDDEGCDYSLIQAGQRIEDAVGFPRHQFEHEVIGNIYENPELLKN